MKDYRVQILFTTPSLGNAKDSQSGRFLFSRNPAGQIVFLPTWHKSNMILAANLLSISQDSVKQIYWDTVVEVELRDKRWHRNYYKNASGRERYSVHEAIMPGQVATLSLVLPPSLTSDTFVQLMKVAGKYKGLSPWKPAEYGRYEVVDVFERPHCSTVQA